MSRQARRSWADGGSKRDRPHGRGHRFYAVNGLARIDAGSTVGALSDLAISGTTTGVGGTIQIENAGTVTGFVQFGGGDNSFLNNGLFNLRHFADTTGTAGAIRCGWP